MRVLYLASEYLPYNNTGTFRTVKFIKALNDRGSKVKVITLDKEAAYEYIGANKIDNSLESISNVSVHRIIPLSLFRYFFSFKSFISPLNESAYKEFFKTIKDTLSKFKADIIIATHPHSATIRLAEYISKKNGIPLVIDMRDTWSYWPMAYFRTRVHHYLVKREEKRIFRSAALVVTVTPEVREIFITTHGDWLRNKIRVIYNSFEGELDVPEKISTKAITSENSIKIGYIGSFYYDPEIREKRLKKWYQRRGVEKLAYFSGNEDWLYRSPYFFLKMLKKLFDINPDLKRFIKVEFIGKKQAWLEDMINELGIEYVCSQVGFLDKVQLNKKYQELDYLLATSEKVINGRSYCLPSKLFDYIKLGKPILAVVTDGVQKTFLKNSGISILLNPDDVSRSVNELNRIFLNNNSFVINKEFLMKFSLENSGNRLGDEITAILNCGKKKI